LPNELDAHREYLHQRMAEGVVNARVLHGELVARGYAGAVSSVRNYIAPLRTAQPQPAPPPPSVRAVTGWITRHPGSLDEDERLRLKTIRAICPELNTLADHVQDFAEMMTNRYGHLLNQWINSAVTTDLPPLRSFARGLLPDYDAVRNGLTLPHSSGPVEGNINRIKMLKRQMYGRANFDLLRIRVLYAR
jgi:hypothetical protein